VTTQVHAAIMPKEYFSRKGVFCTTPAFQRPCTAISNG
jgi:hypothetical protein